MSRIAYTPADLIAFEKEVARRFENREIRAPVHLSGGNEDQIISIFKDIGEADWVFCTYRSHYAALLHGIPPDWIMGQIIAGKSMLLSNPDYRFLSSAIVGGMVPMAVGTAEAIQRQGSSERVWVFVGDMAATTGIFHEAVHYADGHNLPIQFVVEDNGLSTDSPTQACWGRPLGNLLPMSSRIRRYTYTRVWPHVNSGKWVDF